MNRRILGIGLITIPTDQTMFTDRTIQKVRCVMAVGPVLFHDVTAHTCAEMRLGGGALLWLPTSWFLTVRTYRARLSDASFLHLFVSRWNITTERWIGRRGPTEWHARSPDLTPSPLLGGYLKSKVYYNRPYSVDILKTATVEGCAIITQFMSRYKVSTAAWLFASSRPTNQTFINTAK